MLKRASPAIRFCRCLRMCFGAANADVLGYSVAVTRDAGRPGLGRAQTTHWRAKGTLDDPARRDVGTVRRDRVFTQREHERTV